MSITKRIAFGVVSSWIGRCTSILLGLFLMPVLFRQLPSEELGVWLLLGQSWATLGILDLGLGVTLTRRIAFAIGKSGAVPGTALTDETLREVADLVSTGRRMYQVLAIASFAMAFGLGVLGLGSMHLSEVAPTAIWFAWGVLCVAQSLSVWASVWTCLLQGAGYVGWEALLGSLTTSLTLSAQIMVALTGGGIISLAIVAAAGALVQRFLILTVARRKRPELFAIRGSWKPAILKSLAPAALKAWVTSAGLVVVLNSDQYFIAGLKGASEIPAYRAAYLIFLNINMLAVTIASSSSVFIAHLWQAGSIAEVHRLVTRNLYIGLSIMVTGGACILALGPTFFNVWIGNGKYIGGAVSSVFFVLLLLEAQSFIIATCARATEDEAFAISAMIAAALKVVLSLSLGARYGLIGIALGTLVAQLATNHWFMCYRGLRRLRLGLRFHVRYVIAPMSILFGVTFGAVRGITNLLSAEADWLVAACSLFASAFLLSGSIWLLVLDNSQRQFATAYPARMIRERLG